MIREHISVAIDPADARGETFHVMITAIASDAGDLPSCPLVCSLS
jgi:hypothetical protein